MADRGTSGGRGGVPGGGALVICVGQVVTDHTFRVDEVEPPPSKTTARSYAMSVGGLSANAAIAVARLGGRAVFWGRVGRDEAGEELKHALEAEGQIASAEHEVGGRVRREYRLTEKGRGALAKARGDWARQVRAVGAVIEGPV